VATVAASKTSRGSELPSIRDQLGVVGEGFLDTVRYFPRGFPRFAGRVQQFTARAAQAGRRFRHIEEVTRIGYVQGDVDYRLSSISSGRCGRED
jgi:hypothetical protein